MDAADSKCNPTLGFLTVVEHPQYGLFGGYLILNTAGRPLEFHCTAPIKPNRAQEILYGPTLEAFLYGEQIGQTLIGQSSSSPLVVCTDREPALAAREHVSVPVVLVLPPGDCPNFRASENGTVPLDAADTEGDGGGFRRQFSLQGETFLRKPPPSPSCPSASENETVPLDAPNDSKQFFRLDMPHRGGPRLVTFQLGRNRLALPQRANEDRRLVGERLADLAELFDMAEPFQRIRDAIEEAQQAVR